MDHVSTINEDLAISVTESRPSLDFYASFGVLARLPAEIRTMLYSFLLISQSSNGHSYGRGTRISTSILSTSRSIHNEAIDILYANHHTLQLVDDVWVLHRPSDLLSGRRFPPYDAIKRMQSMTLSIPYRTVNRGECEEHIKCVHMIMSRSEPLALHLQHSAALRRLRIELLNTNIRKIGNNHFRSRNVLEEMRKILYLFAFLGRHVDIEICGFNTIQYADMFEEMRERHVGLRPPYDEMVVGILRS